MLEWAGKEAAVKVGHSWGPGRRNPDERCSGL
jgi:hypothetical protein